MHQNSYRVMQREDIDAVMAIEQTVHSHPWSIGNFTDSFDSGYYACVLERDEKIIAYGMMMMVLDEAHLLNLSVAKAHQKQGLGRELLSNMIIEAREKSAVNMFLEVRESNVAAIKLYERIGFSEMSVRRDYYRTDDGRENAILMGMAI